METPTELGLWYWTLGWVGPPRGLKGVVGAEGDLMKQTPLAEEKEDSQPKHTCPLWWGFQVRRRVAGGSPG